MTWRIPPAVQALLAFRAQVAIGAKRRPTTASIVASTGLGLGSVWLMAGSLVEFRRQRTTVNPVSPGAAALVTSGPNQVSRNPMYLGMAGILTAHAILRRSLGSLVPVALFVVTIDRWQIPVEEETLRDRFGDEYATYESTTPRWLGFAVPRSGRCDRRS